MDQLFEDLSPAQEKIIKEICYLQLGSLRRLHNDESAGDVDIELYLAQHEVSREDFKNRLSLQIDRIKRFGIRPDKIQELDESELSIFRHLLNNLADKYKDQYPKAISNLWERLFILGDFKAVEKILYN